MRLDLDATAHLIVTCGNVRVTIDASWRGVTVTRTETIENEEYEPDTTETGRIASAAIIEKVARDILPRRKRMVPDHGEKAVVCITPAHRARQDIGNKPEQGKHVLLTSTMSDGKAINLTMLVDYTGLNGRMVRRYRVTGDVVKYPRLADAEVSYRARLEGTGDTP